MKLSCRNGSIQFDILIISSLEPGVFGLDSIPSIWQKNAAQRVRQANRRKTCKCTRKKVGGSKTTVFQPPGDLGSFIYNRSTVKPHELLDNPQLRHPSTSLTRCTISLIGWRAPVSLLECLKVPLRGTPHSQRSITMIPCLLSLRC